MAKAHKDYSATPLGKKLGIREDARVLLVNAPEGFADRIGPLPAGASIATRPARDTDVIVVFGTERADLRRRFAKAARSLAQDGRLWVAWPKRASNVPTDISFDDAQRVGLDAGLVDNKSASVTDVYQGLQFVYRLKDRKR
jgi:hypothetical protein